MVGLVDREPRCETPGVALFWEDVVILWMKTRVFFFERSLRSPQALPRVQTNRRRAGIEPSGLSAVFNYGYLVYHARWALRKLDATAAPRGTKRQPARSSEPPDAIAAAAPREIVAKRLTRAATCSTLRKAGAAPTTRR